MNTNSQAEVKLRKFRETLTDNADGNPEPSPDNREGAETRHGVCLVCDGPIIDRQKTAKYCSNECKKISRRLPKQNKLCRNCKGEIPSNLNSNAKFCSSTCRGGYNSYNHSVKTGRIKRPGVGSGGNQWGEDNHRYRTGIGTYNFKAFEYYPNVCNRCQESDKRKLLVHHIDHNRLNNDLSNLEILCKKCHQSHHCTRDVITGRFISIT